MSTDQDKGTRTKRKAARQAIIISSDEDFDEPQPRKRKNDDDFSPQPKKIKKTAAKTGENENASPKKRGRPKKILTEGETVVKKEKKDNDGVPKKRGRPKKIKTEDVGSSNIKTESTAEKYSDDENDIKKVKDEIDSSNVKFEASSNFKSMWLDYQLLAEMQDIDLHRSRKLVELFEQGNTIPFIARYRKDVTGNMEPDQLREVKDCYEKINQVKEKQQAVIKSIEKLGKLTPDILRSVSCARTFDEIDHLYAPYKPGAKRSLAERAKAAGLLEPAINMLDNTCPLILHDFVDEQNKEIENVELVEKGIVHIIAHTIATDTEMLNYLRKERDFHQCFIETKKAVKRETKESKEKNNEEVDELKFENYFDFQKNIRYLKPYQILAINRGESLKVLSVKINISSELKDKFCNICSNKWLYKEGENDEKTRRDIIMEAIENAYTKTVQPLLIREIRTELRMKAEKAACDVFSNNVKQLLLSAPLKGCPILAIDPGFTNGCKVAIISPTGSVIAHEVVYPHSHKKSFRDEEILRKMIVDNQCETIALGNGTACRETEAWLTDMINRNVFAPLNVKYTIVNESGVSIYSCSPEAKKEFASLDPVVISAISLARRIQDPLAELVKVEPKHLGVGMYQHDVPKKQLELALNDVVSECVSFTGVDLNTASQCLLRSIAGLTDKRATAIIEYRDSNGSFICRKDLLAVKGIGPKVFEQCAGFLRVGPFNKEEEMAFYRNPKANPLDRTDIHPESYDLAEQIIKKFNLNLRDIGQPYFINTICNMAKPNIKNFIEELNKPEQTIAQVIDALSKPLNYDFRNEISKTPLFKKGLTNIHDLKVGVNLTGCVRNVCDFGCFVDVGVGQDGLIHNSKMNGHNLQIGDTVDVQIINLDIPRKRIGLLAVNKL